MARVTLETILQKFKSNWDQETLGRFFDGIVAAPELPPDQWLPLVGPDLPEDICDALVCFKAAYQAKFDPGFTEGPAPAERLQELRDCLKKKGFDGFVVPRTDQYQGEYIPAGSDRLRWLTGFSGSAGTAIILESRAAIFVDGRYTIQVRQEINEELFEIYNSAKVTPAAWLGENLAQGADFAIDPWLYTRNGMKPFHAAAERAGGNIVCCPDNPVDMIWLHQPAPPLSPVSIQPVEYAGVGSGKKRRDLGIEIRQKKADSVVITASDSIAWLLNIRGRDVPNCPLPLSFGILHADGLFDLFIDARKLTSEIYHHLGNDVRVRPIETFENALEDLGRTGKGIAVDPSTAAFRIFDRLRTVGARIIECPDPCLLAKACKNDIELNGVRAAHKRDGAKVSRFLHWLAIRDPKQPLYELDAVAKLEQLRAEDPLYRDNSFDTISGIGPNGAICHYRVSAASNRKAADQDILLVDSGGQYLDGTTDITRTIAIGAASDEMKRNFTLVLKGHIALARQKFPAGLTGGHLDSLARAPLWCAGLDYDHGTGHGVGCYLNVHEGPQRISKAPDRIALKPGMILSNEPGYYKDGAYGIRIENLLVVRLIKKGKEGEKDLLGFETISFAPIDLSLVDVAMLDAGERGWLNAYHAEVYSLIAPQMDAPGRGWLKEATSAI